MVFKMTDTDILIDPTLMRISVLEKQVATLTAQLNETNAAFGNVVNSLRPLQDNLTRSIMTAFSGVFHNLSESLARLGQLQPTGSFDVKPVPVDTPQSIIVTLVDGVYNFTTSDEPEKIMNEGTEELVKIIKERELVTADQPGWFHITFTGGANVQPT